MDTIISIIETATNLVVGMLSLLIALCLGIITIIIQRRQSKMQRYQYRLDLYEKRFEYYKRLKESFPFSNTEFDRVLFMADDRAFSKDDYTKYNSFYKDSKYEIKFVFGTEVFDLLESFDKHMNSWQNTSDQIFKSEIANKMRSIYFERLNPAMEELLMLKIM